MITKMFNLIFLSTITYQFSLNESHQDQNSILKKFLSQTTPNQIQNNPNSIQTPKSNSNSDQNNQSSPKMPQIPVPVHSNSYTLSPLLNINSINNEMSTNSEENNSSFKNNSNFQLKNEQENKIVSQKEPSNNDMNESGQIEKDLKNDNFEKFEDVKNLENNLISTLKNTRNYKDNRWDGMKEFEDMGRLRVSSLPETEMKIPRFESESIHDSDILIEDIGDDNEYASRTRIDDFIFGNLAEILSDFSSKAKDIHKQKELNFNMASPFF